MKILSIVGARPQFVKLAAITRGIDRLRSRGAALEHMILHTGQHYDPGMSDVFFSDLQIPAPNINLAIGSGQHGQQTGQMLAGIEQSLLDLRPDWTLVYGDTNSTLAGALASAKQHIPVAHLEAGLRSYNRRMPEEINRVLTDHASNLLLAPTKLAAGNLKNEGLTDRIVTTGDVMADVCLTVAEAVREEPSLLSLPTCLQSGESYIVATIHRAENTDDPVRLAEVINGFRLLDLPVVMFAHPRLRAKASHAGIKLNGENISVLDPISYPQMVAAVQNSRGVVTDSGGLQKEAFLLGVPCTTVRAETEWNETLIGGWNVLANDPAMIHEAASRPSPTSPRGTPFGIGNASETSIQAIMDNKGISF